MHTGLDDFDASVAEHERTGAEHGAIGIGVRSSSCALRIEVRPKRDEENADSDLILAADETEIFLKTV